MNATENELGRCGPLANVYKSIVVAGCSRIVNPLVRFPYIQFYCYLFDEMSFLISFFHEYLQNGLWAGIITCILLFLPAIIFSLKLSTLYQKSDPYPGPLVEA